MQKKLQNNKQAGYFTCNLCGVDFPICQMRNVAPDVWLCFDCGIKYYKEKAAQVEAEIRRTAVRIKWLKFKNWLRMRLI